MGFAMAFLLWTSQLSAQATTKGNNGNASTVVSEIPAFPKFIGYPTSHQKPVLLDSGNPSTDRELFRYRLQHWYFIFDQDGYVMRYGKLPQALPDGLTPLQYSQNPPEGAFSADLEKYMQGQATPKH